MSDITNNMKAIYIQDSLDFNSQIFSRFIPVFKDITQLEMIDAIGDFTGAFLESIIPSASPILNVGATGYSLANKINPINNFTVNFILKFY